MSSSALAFITTAHLSMLVVRRHRSRPAGADVLILLPAVIFAALTWLSAGRAGVAFGLVAHLAWFAYCESRFPAPVPVRRAVANVPAIAARATRVPVPAPAATTSRAPVTVPVLAVFDETPDIKTFRFRRPEGFEFTAGQFLTIRVQVDGRAVQRAYSISSSPQAGGYLEISVKRIGLVSGVLHSTLRPGSLVTVRPPAGTFLYPGGDDRPLLLLAGGIGITPLISMLRYATAIDPARRIILMYSVQTPESLAFRDELAVISRRHPQVRIAICVSQGPPSDRWHAGHINEALIRAYVPDPRDTVTYICGPARMMDAMTALMTGMDVPAGQVRTESFGAAMKLVAGDTATDPATAASGEQRRVRFAHTGCEAHVAPHVTLLETAEAHGVEIPSICRAGSCHTCRTRVLEGEVSCDSESLSDEDRAAGYILPCVSRAATDCVLEA